MTKVFPFSFGAIYTTTAYVYYLFLQWHWPDIAVAVMTLASITALTLLVEITVYLPLVHRRASSLVAIISSIGVYTVLINTLAICFGSETKILSSLEESHIQVGPIVLSQIQAWTVVMTLSILAGTALFLKMTVWGKIIRAASDNLTLTELMGISVWKVRMIVSVLSTLLIGTSAIFAALDTAIDPYIGLSALLAGAVAFIIGGVGSFAGTIVGAMILGMLQSFVTWQFSGTWWQVISFGIFIVFLIFRPQGIFGKKQPLSEMSL